MTDLSNRTNKISDYKGAVARLDLNHLDKTRRVAQEHTDNPSFFSRLMCASAKRLVFSQLVNFKRGHLIISDGEDYFSFGNEHSKLKAELIVHDQTVYRDIMTGGSIGAAEAFMTGDWTTPDLTSLIRVMVRNIDVVDGMEGGLAKLSAPLLKWFHSLNENTAKGSRRNIAAHYDLGNDFFELFLDPTMMYSSGIFLDASENLKNMPADLVSSRMKEASLNKLKTICEKLRLTAADHLIEIGSGWGSMAIYAAKHYGCKVTTTTISEEQYKYAMERIKKENLEDKITLLMKDYRDLEGQFDKLVSIEMIEAVGWKYYDTFYEKCASLLKDDGLMLVQAITIVDQRYENARNNVDFIQRYIFPGSCIPSINALNTAMQASSDLRMIHLEDFAQHYAMTLNAWQIVFLSKLDEVRTMSYSEEFIRMWQFYLSYCEGGFTERQIGVAHLVYAKPSYQ
jgi:cyclopropane-fatty-acyl-phospholipid synthase